MKRVFTYIAAAIIAVIALWYSLPYIFGYWTLIESPSRAKLVTPALVTISGMRVNNTPWTLSGSVKIEMLGAMAFFSGVPGISLTWQSDDEKVNKGAVISLFFPSQHSPKMQVGSLFVSQDDPLIGDWLPEQIYRSDLWIENCALGGLPYLKYDEYPRVEAQSIGKLKIKQGFKHLTISGAIKIPEVTLPRDPIYKCANGKTIRNLDPPATVSIDEIRINIDSEVIYSWAGKSGYQYRF